MVFKHETFEVYPLCTTETCQAYPGNATLSNELASTLTGPQDISSTWLEKTSQSLSKIFGRKSSRLEDTKRSAEHQLQDLLHTQKHTDDPTKQEEIESHIRRIEHQLDAIDQYGDDRQSHHLERLRQQPGALH